MKIPKWMQRLDNRLSLDGKKSYIRIRGNNWQVIDENNIIRYSGSRKNWAIAFAQKYWDKLG